ncbi:MAG TPA: alpha/beta hydrolase [Abditibacteriaceae bacterium]|jgi:acetyl esterase/lipase
MMNAIQKKFNVAGLTTVLIATGSTFSVAQTMQGRAPDSTMRRTPVQSASVPMLTTMRLGNRVRQVDPQMKAVLQQLIALKPRPIEKLTPRQARQQPTPADAVKALLQKQGRSTAPEPVGSVTDRTVPSPAGPVRVRVYRPRNTTSTQTLPVLVYFHGGGFVIAGVSTYDASQRALANAANCMVVGVAYRKAPEHKLPAAHEDSYAVTQWLMRNAAQWGGDPNRVAVAGESAGGNLATAVCLMARDRGGRMPIHQLLVYPYVDLTPAQLNTPSAIANATAKPLNRPMLAWFARYALPNQRFARNPLVSPLRTANVRGLPPATIVLAEIDPLLSQGQAYAVKLSRAGVPVRQRLYRGVTHEFFGMGAVVNQAKQAVNFAAASLKSAFANAR